MLTWAILWYGATMQKCGRTLDIGYLPLIAMILDTVIVVRLVAKL